MARVAKSRTESFPLLAVDSVREAKGHLSSYLHDARELGADAPPKFFGAHRRPEAVVLFL